MACEFRHGISGGLSFPLELRAESHDDEESSETIACVRVVMLDCWREGVV